MLTENQEKLKETKAQLLRALQEVARLRKQREQEQEERIQVRFFPDHFSDCWLIFLVYYL